MDMTEQKRAIEASIAQKLTERHITDLAGQDLSFLTELEHEYMALRLAESALRKSDKQGSSLAKIRQMIDDLFQTP